MTDVVNHLIRLGLSEYEARAYIATVALGEGTVKEISDESGVPRSRAYDILERLAKKGLVEVGSSSPICYRANEPLVASGHLMEGFKEANDEVVRELGEIGNRAEKRDNPIWILKGDWAIDHKVSELMESAKRDITMLCFNNRNIILHAKQLCRLSESIPVTVVMNNQPERFVGLLGDCRVLRMKPMLSPPLDMEGSFTERGFVTRDGKYSIEMLVLTDNENSLLITKEGENRKAMIISGTILNFFSHETVHQVIRVAEEVEGTKIKLRSQ
jgi:hypothetical protein